MAHPPASQALDKTAAHIPTGCELWSNWGILSCSNVGKTGKTDESLFGYLPTERMFRPTNQGEIAEAIRQAEKQGKTIRALGSGMSFSGAVMPQSKPIAQSEARPYWLLATDGALEQPNPIRDSLFNFADSFGYAIDTTALNGSLQQLLPTVLDDQQDPASFFFVEAGIKISLLNQVLHKQSQSLALKTMGGTTEQTIAGAVSTGTHGADIDRPPLADNVRAIYLVGAGGVHHWIEPSRPITDAKKICATFSDIKPENIHYDDDMYRSTLVSMGAMGVIYAVILDVVPQYSLLEWNKWSTWEDLQRETQPKNFTPLLDGSWSGLSAYLGKQFSNEAKLPSNRSLQVVINPIKNDDGSHQCFVTNRAELTLREPSGVVPMDVGKVFQHRSMLIRRILDNAHCGIKEAFNFGFAAVRQEFSGNETEVTQKLIAFCKRHNYSWALREITNLLMEKAIPLPGDPPDPHIDLGWKIMAPAEGPIKAPLTLGSTAVESAFAFVPDAINFVNAALEMLDSGVSSKDRVFPAGWISLRATPQSAALLGMQRFEMNGMVEVALLGNADNYGIVQQLEELTRKQGGALHWGQSNELFDAKNVEDAYGKPAIDTWREAQRTLGGDTFTNHLMRHFGLA